jgi:hypothetical protein
VAHHRHSILKRCLKDELAFGQRSVDRLELWLNLEGPESIHLAAPPDFLAKFGFPDEGIQTRRPDETVGVLSHGGSDLIMRLPETADHRKWNRERPVDAIPIH